MKSILATCAALLLTGCVAYVPRLNIRPMLPSTHVNSVEGKPIVIAEVTDSRAPMKLATYNSGEMVRNVGGVLFKTGGVMIDLEDDTVVTLARDLVVQALRNMGYKTVSIDTKESNIPRMKVDVTQFNLSIPNSFGRTLTYRRQMIADISTNITFEQGTSKQSFEVIGRGANIFQTSKAENWEIALNRAMEDYSTRLQAKMLSVE